MHKEDLEYRYMVNRRLKTLDELIMSKITHGEYISDMIDYRSKILKARTKSRTDINEVVEI